MRLRSGSALIHLGVLSIFVSDCVALGIWEISKTKLDNLSTFKDGSSRFICVKADSEKKLHLHNLQASSRSSSLYVAPSQAQITLLENKSVVLNWSIVRFQDREVLYFIIEYVKTHARRMIARCRQWYKCTPDMPTSPYSYVVEGLEQDYNYRFRVAAVYGSEKEHTIYSVPSRWLPMRKMRRKWTTIKPKPNLNPYALWFAGDVGYLHQKSERHPQSEQSLNNRR